LDWQKYVVVDPAFYRPAEVDLLLADPTKAREKLGWVPECGFEELVRRMVRADVEGLGGQLPSRPGSGRRNGT
ncbi:MAG: GDP-mannose 4,6-dehydratase, partial [Planctomycetaceae bacterium]